MMDYAAFGYTTGNGNRVILNDVILPGTATLGTPTVGSNFAYFFTDSIGKGERTLSASGSNPIVNGSSSLAYPYLISAALGYEVSEVGYGGQEITGDNGSILKVATTTPNILQGVSRLSGGKFSPMPAAVFVCQGTNDEIGGFDPTSVIGSYLTALRGYCNSSTPIYILSPPGNFDGTNGKQNLNSVLSAAVTSQSDSQMFYIAPSAKLGTNIHSAINAINPFDGTYDGVHMAAILQAQYSAYWSKAVQATQTGGTTKIIKGSRQESRQGGRN